MTVQTTSRSQTFNGGQSALTFSFRTLTSNPEYVSVTVQNLTSGVQTALTYSTNYTVAVNANGVGGVVTVSPTYSTAYEYIVFRSTGLVQNSAYSEYNQFPASTLENNLDQLTMITQEETDTATRALQLPIGVSPSISTTLTAPTSGGLVLAWDPTAKFIQNVVITGSTGATGPTGPTGGFASDGTQGIVNLITNGNFEYWSKQLTTDPDGWTGFNNGGTGSVGRSSSPKMGTYCFAPTPGSNGMAEYQEISTTNGISYWQGRTLTMGAWIKQTSGGASYISINDGVNGAISYVTVDGNWHWVTVTYKIDVAATYVRCYCWGVNASVGALFDGVIATEGATNIAFSPNPQDFDSTWTDYSASSTITGWSAFSGKYIYTKKVGKTVYVAYNFSGTSNTTGITFTVPYVPDSSIINFVPMYHPVYASDNGSQLTAPSVGYFSSGSTITIAKTYAGTLAQFTASGQKSAQGSFWYIESGV